MSERIPNWICDFCEQKFSKKIASFKCKECDFDLCDKCLFEDENSNINQIYIKLNESKVDII